MSGSRVAKSKPIPIAALTALLWASSLLYANSERSPASVRDQKILQIQRLIEDHNLLAARRLVWSALREFPRDAGLHNLLGIVAAQQGKYKEAEISFDRAVKSEPKFTGAYMNLGRLYQENSGNDRQARQKALEVYARVLNYDPNNVEANYQSALLLLQQKNYRSSLRYFSRLPTEIQGRAQALAIACSDYAALGDRIRSDESAARLNSASDFSEVEAREMLPALAASKRDDLAISLLQGLESRQALSAEMLRALGLAYERASRLAEARTALEQAVSNQTLSVPGLLELARVAYKQRDFRGSLGYLAHAEDLQPENARLYYYFGLVCLDLNLIAEARNAFQKAVRLEPENPQFNYAIGVASSFQHDPAEAVPYFEKYLKLQPQDSRGKLALGAALFRAKDYESAKPWLHEAAKTATTAHTAHYYLGCIALQSRSFEQARAELEESLRGRPNDPDALAELGQYYFLQKNYAEAEKQIRRALEIDPDHYTANFYLLNLYTRTGNAQRETQAKRFEHLQKILDEKTREFLRIIEVRPFEAP